MWDSVTAPGEWGAARPLTADLSALSGISVDEFLSFYREEHFMQYPFSDDTLMAWEFFKRAGEYRTFVSYRHDALSNITVGELAFAISRYSTVFQYRSFQSEWQAIMERMTEEDAMAELRSCTEPESSIGWLALRLTHGERWKAYFGKRDIPTVIRMSWEAGLSFDELAAYMQANPDVKDTFPTLIKSGAVIDTMLYSAAEHENGEL